MRVLYHLRLSPFCRKARIMLDEKGLEVDLRLEKVWERRDEFIAINPAGKVPALVEKNGVVLSDSYAICEYIEETYPEPALIGQDPYARAEIRRIVAWFDDKFSKEVSATLLYEKVVKRFFGMGEPNSQAIRVGITNIHTHLDYIAYLTDQRNWLAGDDFSLADITAAAHISALDYLGDVPWHEHEGAKNWYARAKSRPSFRAILGDHIPGFPPPKHYANLDF